MEWRRGSRPGWGSDSIFAMNRWFAPPANFHDASGVLYPNAVSTLRPEKPGTFVHISTCANGNVKVAVHMSSSPRQDFNRIPYRKSRRRGTI